MVFLIACGDGYTFGPYFLDNGNVTAESYRRTMQDIVVPTLQNHYGRRHFQRLVWQQDGAAPHRARGSLEYLNNVFGDRMLALGSAQGQSWAPSSPDLSPLDFSIWGNLKAKVYTAPLPQTIEELQQKIRVSVQDMRHSYIEKCVHHMKTRATLCLQQNGGHFEGLKIRLNP